MHSPACFCCMLLSNSSFFLLIFRLFSLEPHVFRCNMLQSPHWSLKFNFWVQEWCEYTSILPHSGVQAQISDEKIAFQYLPLLLHRRAGKYSWCQLTRECNETAHQLQSFFSKCKHCIHCDQISSLRYGDHSLHLSYDSHVHYVAYLYHLFTKTIVSATVCARKTTTWSRHDGYGQHVRDDEWIRQLHWKLQNTKTNT